VNLDDVRRCAMSLPEVTEEPHHHFSSFRIGGKIFATVPPGESHVHLFVDESERALAIAANPDAFEKLWWGKKVVGLRVALVAAQKTQVEDLLFAAWCRKAPKRLAEGRKRVP
jgi:hypothetical protein